MKLTHMLKSTYLHIIYKIQITIISRIARTPIFLLYKC